jgi:outer membrane lipoprotein carrier protein
MIRLKYLIFLLLCFSLSVYASTEANQLSALLNAVQSMQADFTQTIYDNQGKAVQQSTGHIALQRPGKFRWEVVKPIPQLIIANGTRLYIYDPDLQQLTIRTINQADDETPAILLSHVNATLDKIYNVKILTKSTAGLQWFSLIPRGADNMLASIQLGFANQTIQQMQLQDHLGHTTKIYFQHISANKKLSAMLFNFIPPANVDVIDETGKH